MRTLLAHERLFDFGVYSCQRCNNGWLLYLDAIDGVSTRLFVESLR